mmetsp:Transcript_6050/g.9649  ORF Transcript_6050/g.9649 Transcript_6050/m.9649 type:complete len:110 (-) Transcript_6050:162-491(-)
MNTGGFAMTPGPMMLMAPQMQAMPVQYQPIENYQAAPMTVMVQQQEPVYQLVDQPLVVEQPVTIIEQVPVFEHIAVPEAPPEPPVPPRQPVEPEKQVLVRKTQPIVWNL